MDDLRTVQEACRILRISRASLYALFRQNRLQKVKAPPFDAVRPMILNGIEEIVERPDLADRSIILTLEPIPDERRRPEGELWAAFETERARILGVFLDGVVQGLARLPETRLERLPRMADFATWATACETAIWPAGTFTTAYSSNLATAVEGVIDGDPVAAAVHAIMATVPEWTGTASDLLDTLAKAAGERVTKSKTWPNGPRALSGRLRRAATFLRKVGIEISFRRDGHGRTRTICITRTPSHAAPTNAVAQPSAPSAPSASAPKPNPANSFDVPPPNNADAKADDSGPGGASTVRANPLKTNAGTVADGADANNPPQGIPPPDADELDNFDSLESLKCHIPSSVASGVGSTDTRHAIDIPNVLPAASDGSDAAVPSAKTLNGSDRPSIELMTKLGVTPVLINNPVDVPAALAALGNGKIGVDIETMPLPQYVGQARRPLLLNKNGTVVTNQMRPSDIGLDPYRATIATLQLYAGGLHCFVFRATAITPELRRCVLDSICIIHNAGFELAFMQHH